MSTETKIEWTDATFNPWIGCTKVGPGCDNCYAEVSTPSRTMNVVWGPKAPRMHTSTANWNLPKRWNSQHEAFFAEHSRRRRVFCASLADVFDNAVAQEWREELWRLVQATPNLDWLILTKRISNVHGMVPPAWVERDGWPAHVRIGATIVNQEEAARDIPKLLALRCPNFLSMEPLLAPVNLMKVMVPNSIFRDMVTALRRLDWVIVGGESGPKARPMHPDWARDLRDQCDDFAVPFLFKQWGEWIEPDIDGMPVRLTAREGDPEFFDAAAKVDGFLCVDGRFEANVDDLEDDVRYLGMKRVGKKAAGRLLDGVTHDGYPA